jgi:hypothetical protein
MKSKFITFAAALLLLSLLAVSRAQAENDETVKANIPFTFYAGNQSMPAGAYEVGIDVANRLITIRDRDGHNGSFLMGLVSDKGSDGNPVMVFDHLGDSYFLRDVQTAETGVNFPTQKVERMLARNSSPEEVTVALLRE